MAGELNNPYLLTALILGILNLLLLAAFFWQFRTHRTRQAALRSGESGANLEEIVLRHKKILATHNKNLKELGEILEELVENNKLNIQKVGVVRFNPFADTGANMSFVVALLDAKDNGIVISSLHGREGTRIYAKPLEHGVSTFRLTDEERQAIQGANGKNASSKAGKPPAQV